MIQKRVDETKGTTMSLERAKQIAFGIARYEAARREFTINPHEDELETKARQWMTTKEKLAQFHLALTFPIVVKEVCGLEIEVIVRNATKITERDLLDLAYEMVRCRAVDLHPETFRSRLRRIEKQSGLRYEELEEFYMAYVVPQAIGAIRGTQHVSIYTSNGKPPRHRAR
jgi:hypothetical protein